MIALEIQYPQARAILKAILVIKALAHFKVRHTDDIASEVFSP